MKKLYDKILKMDAKKGIIKIMVATVLFCMIAGIGVGVKFGNRISDIEQKHEVLEQQMEQNHDGLYKEIEQSDYYQEDDVEWEEVMNFTTSDYVFLGIIGTFGVLLVITYWLWMVAYAISKSAKVGANQKIFGWLTLFLNIGGVFLLWIYIAFHTICPVCGKMQSSNTNYCKNCGTELLRQCPDCGARINTEDKYCRNCGKKML
ncbi:MAG: zinc ribbon domain-containing protein [Massilibacteroides sp.]|nr:zinc ribbon domain-containing protein [Massilibacteroides sp.]